MVLSEYGRSELVVKVVHTDISRLMDEWTDSGVTVYSAKTLDALTAELCVPMGSYKIMKGIAERRNAIVEVINRKGIYWKIRYLLQRPFLIICTLLVLGLSMFIPTRVWFITVKGNSLLPDKQIIEAAEKIGIYFGASRRHVRSEQTKNRLLENIPQLQWVGVNTRGCIAEISVSERATEVSKLQSGLSRGIVAARDGVIRSVAVTGGNCLCHVGQVVQAGELLISSYRDCGMLIQRERAEGEIFAETLREIETVIPSQRTTKGDVKRVIKKFSIRIGKKRIKFYKDSGICGTTCDKMYEEYCVKLPGGFSLPVAIITEQWLIRDGSSIAALGNDLSRNCRSAAESYLLEQMIAGQVLSEKTEIIQGDTVYRLTGQYRCLEMIGRVQNEELLAYYGKTD